MEIEAIKKLLTGFDRVVKEFNLRNYHDEWLVELVDTTRVDAHTELAALEKNQPAVREEEE